MVEKSNLTALKQTPHADVFEQREPRTIRLQLEAGQHLPSHSHPDTNIVLHLLSGQLELTLDENTYELAPGELIRFSGNQEISPHAVEPSTAVIVFAPQVD